MLGHLLSRNKESIYHYTQKYKCESKLPEFTLQSMWVRFCLLVGEGFRVRFWLSLGGLCKHLCNVISCTRPACFYPPTHMHDRLETKQYMLKFSMELGDHEVRR